MSVFKRWNGISWETIGPQISNKKLDALDVIIEQTGSKNIFNNSFPNSGLIDPNGADMSSNLYMRTNYLPIDASQNKLYILRSEKPYLLYIAFYDLQKEPIGKRIIAFARDIEVFRNDISIPSTASFYRLAVSVKDFKGILCLSYEELAEVVPYSDFTGYIIKDKVIAENNLTEEVQTKLNKIDSVLKNKNIVFMGDSVIGDFYDVTGICSLLSEKTQATVINCAFSGTRMAYRYGDNIQYTYQNALSGVELANAIANSDWSMQDIAVANMTNNPDYFTERLAQLKLIDWSTIDYILWEYGTNDFMTEVKLDGLDLYAYNYAYRHAIETILTVYPNIRIIPITPMYIWYQNDGIFIDDSNTHLEADYAGIETKLTDFVIMVQNISKEYNIPYIDNYYTLGANKFTRFIFFNTTDGIIPNANGRARVAEHIAAQLLSLVS